MNDSNSLPPNTPIVVAMSGGVDSSVSALLLKQAGYQVSGLFMRNWEEEDDANYCAAAEDLGVAEAVCKTIDIPLHRINFAAEYWDNVFEYFLAEYKAGRTPNPDILCNREIKFKAFWYYAKELGAVAMATGHYVRKTGEAGSQQLRMGLDANKDQSYFLYALNQTQLMPALFPVGEMEKPSVRKIAEQAGLANFNKKDSTGICFIGERKFKNFLQRYLPAQPGDIQTVEGKRIGQHDGLMYYTLGQRQGIGLGGQKDAKEAPWYVAEKKLNKNTLVVVQGHEHPLLYSENLRCQQMNWIAGVEPTFPLLCTAKTRYRQDAAECMVTAMDDSDCFDVKFKEAQWAITPGQSVVFYQADICLGGGVIV